MSALIHLLRSPVVCETRRQQCKSAVLRSGADLGDPEHTFGLRLIAGQTLISLATEDGPNTSLNAAVGSENEALFQIAGFLFGVLVWLRLFVFCPVSDGRLLLDLFLGTWSYIAQQARNKTKAEITKTLCKKMPL